MLRKILLATVFTFPYVLPCIPAAAQNVTCATRSPGDSTNACASTAFVHSQYPLSIANGGTGTSTPGLIAGANIIITGSWPNNTIASSGGAGSGVVGSGTRGQVAGYPSSGTSVIGVPLQCTPIEAWGGGTGVSDNGAPYNAATAAFTGGSGCLSFGPGTYAFTTQPVVTYGTGSQSVTVAGSGPDATILSFATGNGLLFTMGASSNPSFHVRDLSIVTGGAPTSGFTALNATFLAAQLAFPPTSDITRVNTRASTVGSRTTGWGTGISLQGVSFVNMNSVNVNGMPTPSSGAVTGGSGVGLRIAGDSALSSYGVIFNISDSNFSTNLTGIVYGDFVQGVTLARTNVNFNTVGIQTISSPVGVLAGLLASDSNFNNYGNNIVTNAHLDNLQLSNNLFIIFPSSTGVLCNPCDNSTIIGNTFAATSLTGTFGVVLSGSNAGPITIVGNTFAGIGQAINVAAGETLVNIQSNGYNGNTVKIQNAGSITAGSCTGVAGTCTAGATP